MFKKTHSLWLVLVLFAMLFSACGGDPAPDPVPIAPEAPVADPAATAQESLPVSETATVTEEKLEKAEPVAHTRVLPADHWLVGTSNEEDMLHARIARKADRVFLRSHDAAYLEQIGSTRVLHLEGSHYEMGVQHGKLMADEIRQASFMIKLIGSVSWKKDVNASIEEAWKRTSPHIPEKYKEEMQGMADGAEIPLEEVQMFSIFPELFHCSGFAMWGKATADGELLHGRVLDYMRDAGLDKFALVIISKPTTGNAFVNIAYSGMLGSVTGMNVQQVAIGEMGGSGQEKWDGMPMSFLMREVLERANTLEEACKIMEETPRTCQYYYCISDAKANDGKGDARGVAAETDSILFVKPNEFNPMLARPMEDAVLMSAGGRYTCLADRTEKMYGKFTPLTALDLMARGVSMKSNMHNVLFKPKTLELWVANSTIESPACNLPYTHYDLKKLMNERPTK